MATYPRRVWNTARAVYWEVRPGIYQATKGEPPTNDAGYASLLAIMQLKGEPWKVRMPVMERLRYGLEL